MEAITLEPRRSQQTCPWCHDDLDTTLDCWTCAGCRASYHPECASECATCGTPGCPTRFAAAPVRGPSEATAAQARVSDPPGVPLSLAVLMLPTAILFLACAIVMVWLGIIDVFMDCVVGGLGVYLIVWLHNRAKAARS